VQQSLMGTKKQQQENKMFWAGVWRTDRCWVTDSGI